MLQLLYITCANHAEAVQIAKTLLAEKLIACANILGDSTSLYHWQGELKQQVETIMIAKTTQHKTADAMARIRALHSYDTPCVLVLPIEVADVAFMQWVQDEIENAL